ncbi:OmpA family protein [Thalassotalea euphylliae]|uniref:OmpA family protein n=1 Tax=Thalassotalea euphylliae TaxID=1655234 RepID=UPI00362BC0CF
MKNKTLSLLALASLSAHTVAGEQPDASQLVGQAYGGVHYSYFNADDDRYKILDNAASTLDDGDGLGVELGYRFSEMNEIRIQYTDLSVDADSSLFGEQDGSSVALDLLHFPNKQQFYYVGGFKDIDLEDKEVSANVGIGIRHYFSTRFAAYIEGKGHYQFEDHHKDWTASIGLMYFFGENKKRTVAKEPVVTTEPALVANVDKDSDNDGVMDSKDSCPNTPENHMVDSLGCTLFSDEVKSMRLLVNFDNNSAEVKNEYTDEIEKAANFLNAYQQANLTIEGHSSAVGNADYNKKLSLKRAQAIVDMLVNNYGIEASRLNAVGYGEERLLNSENSAEAHSENRRIMARVEVTEKVVVEK